MTDVLTAFAQALELERELGMRTVEIDRALLRNEPPPRQEPSPTAPVEVKREEPKPSPKAAPVVLDDFAFVVEEAPKDEVLATYEKMMAAMGYEGKIKICRAGKDEVAARVAIFFGSNALKMSGVHGALGAWIKWQGRDAIATHSVKRVLKYFGDKPQEVLKFKREIWNHLQMALLHLGKKPPAKQGEKR